MIKGVLDARTLGWRLVLLRMWLLCFFHFIILDDVVSIGKEHMFLWFFWWLFDNLLRLGLVDFFTASSIVCSYLGLLTVWYALTVV